MASGTATSLDLRTGVDLVQGVLELVCPPDANVLVFPWEDCPRLHVPILKRPVADGHFSELPQYCAGYISESEVTGVHENVHDRHDGPPDDNGESMEQQCPIRAEGGVNDEGEEGRDEVRDGENPSYNLISDCHPFIHLPEVDNGACEEQEDGGV